MCYVAINNEYTSQTYYISISFIHVNLPAPNVKSPQILHTF